VEDRASIVAHLREIAALLELHGGNKFKTRAFARGARALEGTRRPIGDLIAENALIELPGIGVALAKQIEELFRSGKSELLESLRGGLPSGVLELSQVAGIGLHALQTLHQELGIATIDDLRKAAEEGRLREAKGFGEKKEKKVLEAIKKYETRGPTIMLADGLLLAEEMESELAAMERGIPFVLSVDAHAMRELDNVRYAIGLARRAGVQRDEVLNARSAAAFARAVKPTAGRRAA
jgi:DNA polymerase (family 10)